MKRLRASIISGTNAYSNLLEWGALMEPKFPFIQMLYPNGASECVLLNTAIGDYAFVSSLYNIISYAVHFKVR